MYQRRQGELGSIWGTGEIWLNKIFQKILHPLSGQGIFIIRGIHLPGCPCWVPSKQGVDRGEIPAVGRKGVSGTNSSALLWIVTKNQTCQKASKRHGFIYTRRTVFSLLMDLSVIFPACPSLGRSKKGKPVKQPPPQPPQFHTILRQEGAKRYRGPPHHVRSSSELSTHGFCVSYAVKAAVIRNVAPHFPAVSCCYSLPLTAGSHQ